MFDYAHCRNWGQVANIKSNRDEKGQCTHIHATHTVSGTVCEWICPVCGHVWYTNAIDGHRIS